MRGYWFRIVLGAAAIFVVGYGVKSVIERSVGGVRRIAESSDPISIPLAFVPFKLDGVREGTFRGLRIERSSPHAVEAFHIRVQLGDSADTARIQGCRLAMVGNGRDFDPGRGFRCVAAGEPDSSLVDFGTVEFAVVGGGEFTVAFLVDSAAARELRSEGVDRAAEAARAAAEREAAAARAEADRIRAEVRSRVDSSVRSSVRARNAPQGQ